MIYTYRGLADTSNLVVDTFDGDEYLVVPVVGMVGGIAVNCLGSDGYELVPVEVLSSVPESWNGRPVCDDHPGNLESANTPRTLEEMAFGYVFNAGFEKGKLVMEAWLNLVKAKEVGDEALRVYHACQAGEMVEVSICGWVQSKASTGVGSNGKRYKMEWTSIKPDHLAMGLHSDKGACAITDGCGGPRQAKEKRVDMGSKILGSMFRYMDRLRASQEVGVGNSELWRMLSDKLRSDVPAFEYIVEIYPDLGRVIFSTFPKNEEVLLRLNYLVDDDGEVTLVGGADSAVEQKEIRTYVDAVTGAKADGGEETTHKGETEMKKLKALCDGLISGAWPFEEKDRKALEGFGEERLEKMSAVKPIDSKPDEMTDEQWLERAPENVRAMVQKAEKAEKDHRDDMIESLAKSQTSYSPESLKSKDTKDLEDLSNLVKSDYGDLGIIPDKESDIPKPYSLSLAKRRAASN